MSNSALQEKFNSIFQEYFASINKILVSEGTLELDYLSKKF